MKHTAKVYAVVGTHDDGTTFVCNGGRTAFELHHDKAGAEKTWSLLNERYRVVSCTVTIEYVKPRKRVKP